MEQDDCPACRAQGSDLKGSDKQVAWAKDIRASLRRQLDKLDAARILHIVARHEDKARLTALAARLTALAEADREGGQMLAAPGAVGPVRAWSSCSTAARMRGRGSSTETISSR